MYNVTVTPHSLRTVDRQLPHLIQDTLYLLIQRTIGVVVSDVVGKVSKRLSANVLHYIKFVLTSEHQRASRSPPPRTSADI
jgi:hypothetical protein